MQYQSKSNLSELRIYSDNLYTHALALLKGFVSIILSIMQAFGP
jgi:hypothetical protein